MAKFLAFLSFTALLAFLVLFQPQGYKCEIKSARAVKRCGYDFISAYIHCCENINQCRMMTDVRGLPDKKDAKQVLSKLKATSFLKKQDKIFHRSRRSFVNPYEECCIEGCTLKEISEYGCH